MRPALWSWLARMLPVSSRAKQTTTSPELFAYGAAFGACVVWLAIGVSRPSNVRPEDPSAVAPVALRTTAATPQLATESQTLAAANTTAASTAAIARKLTASPPQPRRLTATSRSRPEDAPPPERAQASPSTVAQFRGTIEVNSQPERAQVALNGVLVGTSPLMLVDIPVGSRVVRVQLTGYQSWSDAIRVVANQRTKVMATLVPTITP